MKTVLIVTDFSKASRNASLYGMAFAKNIGARIYLFNSYKIPNPAPGLNTGISRYDIMMQTDKRLLEEADEIDQGRSEIEIICDEGESSEAIVKSAKEKSVDFIIIGMKGSGKNVKKIFGSTATTLARNCRIPVIIVPEQAKYQTPKILVYASDSVVADTAIPVAITELSRIFNSRVFVVKVATGETGEFAKENKDIRKNIPNTFFEYITDTDVSHGLNNFIVQHSADMLVMVPHKHEMFERLFKKSETKDMIFHTKIPLMILPETKSSSQHPLKEKRMHEPVEN